MNVYLNDGAAEDGGHTRFYPPGVTPDEADARGAELADLAVAPRAGRAVLFRQPPEQDLLHDGERLRGGVKYLLRTDVMYRRRGASSEGSECAGASCPCERARAFGRAVEQLSPRARADCAGWAPTATVTAELEALEALVTGYNTKRPGVPRIASEVPPCLMAELDRLSRVEGLREWWTLDGIARQS